MYPGIRGEPGERCVRRHGRDDVDGVELLPGEHCGEVRMSRRHPELERLAPRPVDVGVADRHQVDIRRIAPAGEMKPADRAGAGNADPQAPPGGDRLHGFSAGGQG